MPKLNIELLTTTINKLCENYDFNDTPMYYVDKDELQECDDVYDIIQLFTDANDDRQITDTEIIYYTNAMDYLKEHDASLTTSLWLAADMGYTVQNMSSENLASLLVSDNNYDDYQRFLQELEKELDAMDNLFKEPHSWSIGMQ